MLIVGYLCYKRRKLRFLQHNEGERNQDTRILELGLLYISFHNFNDKIKRGTKKGQECRLFSFTEIAAATGNFSLSNKLGEGGFGPVYKGMLLEGQQIAVKKLARNSLRGIEEFMNEIALIAELQHVNLVFSTNLMPQR